MNDVHLVSERSLVVGKRPQKRGMRNEPDENGKGLMTFVLLAQAVSGFALDWSGNHLLNPLWHPHARFHGALLLFMLAGVSAAGSWLLWRKSTEPEVAI